MPSRDAIRENQSAPFFFPPHPLLVNQRKNKRQHSPPSPFSIESLVLIIESEPSFLPPPFPSSYESACQSDDVNEDPLWDQTPGGITKNARGSLPSFLFFYSLHSSTASFLLPITPSLPPPAGRPPPLRQKCQPARFASLPFRTISSRQLTTFFPPSLGF